MEQIDINYEKLDLYLKDINNNDIPQSVLNELDKINIRKLQLIYMCLKNKLENQIKELCGKYKLDNIINFLKSNDPMKSIYSKFVEFINNDTFIDEKKFKFYYEKITVNDNVIKMLKDNNIEVDKINKIEEFIDFVNNTTSEEENDK